MKVLQIIDTLEVGGAERVFVDMCNILYENNRDVSALILLKDKGELAGQLKVPILPFSRKSKWSVVSMYNCSKILKQFDIIHCHSKHVFRYIWLVNILSGVKKNIILQDHSSFKTVGKQLLLFKYLLKPQHYIGVSEEINQHAVKKIGLSIKSVYLLENIILRTNVKQTRTITDFVLVSNIKSSKNNLFALEVVKSFSKKSIRIIGHVQGQSYYEKLRAFSEKNKLSTNFVTNSQEVQSILKNSKVGLHTSPSETGPLVLIEYLAQGLPFLAYETGEVAKILKPHFPEYFIDNFKVAEWKERLDLIMNSTPNTPKMERVFEQYFGEEQYFEKLENIYACIKT
ncbi:glycosyltransferase [Aequorivita viscosa]|uniref:Glycosyltransferase involved in cell wall bisynthesis n=1 Tax=Aequorivita viscosa TaxID=797419 RepID=A0A1M6GHU4_9FLAO|nr:glycosyltransferase [Aequorivita viscosa]SDW84349.1 Glycosyltransferase involved in cell wall bisynthesis [Aequorivita viscosa]SHJ09463.1 Glycosyltransferase involved in cell wall bisynthesis [Aequorivita viscosa]